MIRPITIGIILAAFLCVSGCVRPYERTLVIEEVAPPITLRYSSGIQPNASRHVLVLQLNKFWNEFVSKRIPPPLIAKDIRAGFSVSTKSVRKTNGFIIFEFRIRLRSGGKEAFDAIQAAYVEFIDHSTKEAANNTLRYWYAQLKKQRIRFRGSKSRIKLKRLRP
jgi:hypothetical protein